MATYDAGVKDYAQTYWEPDYEPKDTDLLACFKITPQEGVPARRRRRPWPPRARRARGPRYGPTC